MAGHLSQFISYSIRYCRSHVRPILDTIESYAASANIRSQGRSHIGPPGALKELIGPPPNFPPCLQVICAMVLSVKIANQGNLNIGLANLHRSAMQGSCGGYPVYENA